MIGFYIFRCSTPKKERAGSKMTSSDEEKTGLCCRTCSGTVDTYPDVFDTFCYKITVESLNFIGIHFCGLSIFKKFIESFIL